MLAESFSRIQSFSGFSPINTETECIFLKFKPAYYIGEKSTVVVKGCKRKDFHSMYMTSCYYFSTGALKLYVQILTSDKLLK